MPRAAKAPPCIGVVLAGGRSTRMGCDKAMLNWRGRVLLDHQLQTLRAAGVDAVRVSGMRPEHAGIIDREAQAGPLGGVAAVVASLSGHAEPLAELLAELLVIPVDMPRLSAALLRRLRVSSETEAAALRFNGHVLPMRLRVDAHTRQTLHALMALRAARARSLRALQQRVGLRQLPLQAAESAQLSDCNTPAQWQQVQA